MLHDKLRKLYWAMVMEMSYEEFESEITELINQAIIDYSNKLLEKIDPKAVGRVDLYTVLKVKGLIHESQERNTINTTDHSNT